MTVLIVSAPSGAGKTTLVERLMAARRDMAFSVSHTTRPPRPGDVPGQSYHFVDRPTFERMAREGAFVEWAEVHGNLYGTAAAELDRIQAGGRHPVLDIDVQGASQVRRRVPDVISVFVVPPSLSELRRRLSGRASDAAGVVERRLRGALAEIAHATRYDYVIVNDDLERAADDLLAVVRAALLTPRRMAPALDVLGDEDATGVTNT